MKTDAKSKAQASGLWQRIRNLEFTTFLIFVKKNIVKIRIAIEKLEEGTNIIDTFEMFESITIFFKTNIKG